MYDTEYSSHTISPSPHVHSSTERTCHDALACACLSALFPTRLLSRTNSSRRASRAASRASALFLSSRPRRRSTRHQLPCRSRKCSHYRIVMRETSRRRAAQVLATNVTPVAEQRVHCLCKRQLLEPHSPPPTNSSSIQEYGARREHETRLG